MGFFCIQVVHKNKKSYNKQQEGSEVVFTEKSFAVFEIAGLEPRMNAIRQEIQPVFRTLNDRFKPYLEKEIAADLYLHIAQHRRRSVYPPESTLSALSQNKRGYKMEPHFQLGICEDYVFMWLSLIDQPPQKTAFAQKMINHIALFEKLPQDTVINGNHLSNDIFPLEITTLKKLLTRLENVKKGEFQIGRIISKESPLWHDPKAAEAYMMATYLELLPIYQLLMRSDS